jgi:hypothetical protein
MNISEIRERYEAFKSIPLSNLSPMDEGEYVQILSENPWIRAVLVRTQDSVRMELEFQTSPTSIQEKLEVDHLAVLEEFLSRMEMLHELANLGFEIDILEDSCVWTASKVIGDEIDSAILMQLAKVL